MTTQLPPIAKVAAALLGEPNAQLSSENELRYGTHGSLAVDLLKDCWHDHESNVGGGVLALIERETDKSTRAAQFEWLEEQGLAEASTKTDKSRIVATYDYRDEAGNTLFEVVRYEPKTFRQRRPDGAGKWTWKVKGVRRVPYRLPELQSADAGNIVFIVEGEKDADRLAGMGLVATCNAGGASKWHKELCPYLQGRRVAILPDNDDAGAAHAKLVLNRLRGISECRIVQLPGLPEKGDVSDWLNAGGTAERLQQLAEQAFAQAPDTSPDSGDEKEERKPSQTDMLVKFARERFDLLHDRNGDAYAQDRHSGEVRRLGSRQFKDRLVAGFFDQTEIAVRDQAWREALGTLQALARFSGEPKEMNTRAAGRDGRYWLDLCQPGNARAVEIDAKGWRIVDRAPVLFVRGESMQPLPDPAPGKVDALWEITNIPEAQRLLVLTWLIECLRPETPYPGLELIGEQGSGKSTAAEALRRLIDPNACNLRGAPKETQDIFVAAGQSHVVSYENVSHLAGAMQDALAILSTGGGFAKRQLYTDAEEHIINVRRPWMVNGIVISITQQDLVDRVISIECPVIGERQSSSRQWKEFELAQPGILGALLSIFSGALAHLPQMALPAEERPRLVEFVLLGMATAKACGKAPGDFVNVFKETRADTIARTLDASPVASAVLEFVDTNPAGIRAPVKEILARLEPFKPIGAEAWPRTPKGLGDALRRAAPALRQMGVECRSEGKGGHAGVISWSIQKVEAGSMSAKSGKSGKSGNDADMRTLRTSSPVAPFDAEAI